MPKCYNAAGMCHITSWRVASVTLESMKWRKQHQDLLHSNPSGPHLCDYTAMPVWTYVKRIKCCIAPQKAFVQWLFTVCIQQRYCFLILFSYVRGLYVKCWAGCDQSIWCACWNITLCLVKARWDVAGLKDTKSCATEVSLRLAWPPLQIHSQPFVWFFVWLRSLMAIKRDMVVVLSPQH